jgi:hypothetical protein
VREGKRSPTLLGTVATAVWVRSLYETQRAVPYIKCQWFGIQGFRRDGPVRLGHIKHLQEPQPVRGIGTALELTVRRPIDRTSLYDLIAAMTRYGLSLAVLRPLCDEHSDGYFQDPKKYWHSAVYGSVQK